MSSTMRIAFVSAIVVLIAVGCEEGTNPEATLSGLPVVDGGSPHCGPEGRSVRCVGPSGCEGAQVCRASGSYDACDCGMPAQSECAPAGSFAICTGEGGCTGHQVCTADGQFGACACLDELRSGVSALEITAPEPDATVAGVLEITGTAAGSVAGVAISIANGPFLQTEDAQRFSLRFDITGLADGPITILALATGEDGSQLQRWLQVRVANVDPIVGTWHRTQPEPVQGDPQTRCVASFFGNGALDTTACPYGFLSGARIWERRSNDLIELTWTWTYKLLVVGSASGETLMLRHAEGLETYRRTDSGNAPPSLCDEDAGMDDQDDGC
jgi:hypothetical protein